MPFNFKQFSIDDKDCAMKIGTDGVLLGAWASLPEHGHIIDIGTGSGLIALMTAQRTCDIDNPPTITGIELDDSAYRCADANIAASPWADRITIVHADFAEYTCDTPPELIVSNPPFFVNGIHSPDSTRASARHCDGTLSPLSLIRYAATHLASEGSLAMITPADLEQDILFESTMHRMTITRRCDITTVPGKKVRRILWQMQRGDPRQHIPTEHSTLTIKEPDGQFSTRYKALTAPFYLDF